MQLGERIRAFRKEQELSLEQLAEKSGVALATLSRMENGKGGGNFRTHQKIAQALGLAITDLYQGLNEPEADAVLAVPQPEEAETFTYDEKASAVFLAKQLSAKQMLPQLVVLRPGGKTSLEQYRKGTERWLFVLEGTAEITVGNKNYRLGKESTLYFKASQPHRLANNSRVMVKVVSVTSPATL